MALALRMMNFRNQTSKALVLDAYEFRCKSLSSESDCVKVDILIWSAMERAVSPAFESLVNFLLSIIYCAQRREFVYYNFMKKLLLLSVRRAVRFRMKSQFALRNAFLLDSWRESLIYCKTRRCAIFVVPRRNLA